ncbi:MAG: hypothetical protein Ct9H300mP21_00840 [Pseudomonadota bacterium]|nr:MAG: hypothetical protein Ct9H300mP21_00840 [Pseudomonadota bacterium]
MRQFLPISFFPTLPSMCWVCRGHTDGPWRIVVVSLEQAVAAPFVSSRLADAGARVLKIERPEGDFARNYDRVVNGQSAYFVWLNRGKERFQWI